MRAYRRGGSPNPERISEMGQDYALEGVVEVEDFRQIRPYSVVFSERHLCRRPRPSRADGSQTPAGGGGFELLVKEGSKAWVGEDGEDDVTLHRCRR